MTFSGKWAFARLGCLGLASLTIVLVGAGCGSDDDSNNATPANAPVDLHALYSSDVQALANVDPNMLASYDQQNSGLITEVFGGTTGANLTQYYNARVHYAFTIDDLDSGTIYPTDFQYQGWMTPAQSNNSSISHLPNVTSDSGQIQAGALNISTLFWLDGVLNNTTVVMTVAGQTIPIDSSRTGVIMLGPLYTPTQQTDSGRVIPIPAAYRQAILLHEARHSDCTGGLSQAEIQAMRSATSSDQFFTEYPRQRCGHTHVTCKSGTYEGLAACDSEKYGAYTVGALFLAAAQAESDSVAQEIDAMTAIDYFSRYSDVGNDDQDEQVPDMSSSGVIN
jgi:hypothetical protein